MKVHLLSITSLFIWVPVACLAFQQGSGNPGQDRPATQGKFPWHQQGSLDRIAGRFPPPEGFNRIELPADSFGSWLRQLPLLPGKPRVKLFDGRIKANQSAHIAVLDLDVGRGNLQQCADAIIRLRAEYLWAMNRKSEIQFRFTSGHPAEWSAWQSGMRPVIQGQEVHWRSKARDDSSYANFRKYLDTVFTYAGSASLARALQKVSNAATILPGDIFIQGGYPGHAVIVLDVAENVAGQRVFLLAQSYMPAQQMHVLRAPGQAHSPWYRVKKQGELKTPEWSFRASDLRRFPN